MKQGFLYLCTVVDWYSRFILSWEISNTLTIDYTTVHGDVIAFISVCYIQFDGKILG